MAGRRRPGPSVTRPPGRWRPSGEAEPVDLPPVEPGSAETATTAAADGLQPATGLPRRWYVVPLLVVGAAAIAHAVMGRLAGTSEPPVPRGAGGDERPPPGWERGAVGPLPSKVGYVSAWTGSEMVIWGGGPAPDGAAYNPSSRSWRRIPPAPFAAPTGAASAWTGFELLVWGGETGGPRAVPSGAGGAYDAAADVWRPLPPAPLSPRRPLAAAWTGDAFVIVGGTADSGEPLADGAAYDPRGNRWKPIAALPIAFRQAVAVWTGQEVVVFGTTAAEPATPAGVAWHPASDRWRTLPASPLTGSRVTAVWTGRELLAWDDMMRSAALEVVSGQWRALPDIPSVPGFCDPAGVVAGAVVFAETCGRGAVYDPAAGRWSTTTHPYFLSGQPVWTGRRLLWWTGAFRSSKDSIWMFSPLRPPGPEAAAGAPGPVPAAGAGERCGVELSGRTEPAQVRPGDDFVWVLSVANRSPCRLAQLSLNGFVSPTRFVRYWLVAEAPSASESMLHSFSAEGVDTGVVWPRAGTLEPGAVREFAVRGRLAPNSAPGRIEEDVDVTAVPDGRAAGDEVTARIRLAVTIAARPGPAAPAYPGAGGQPWGRGASAGSRPARRTSARLKNGTVQLVRQRR